jgi:hypothetical protein
MCSAGSGMPCARLPRRSRRRPGVVIRTRLWVGGRGGELSSGVLGIQGSRLGRSRQYQVRGTRTRNWPRLMRRSSFCSPSASTRMPPAGRGDGSVMVMTRLAQGAQPMPCVRVGHLALDELPPRFGMMVSHRRRTAAQHAETVLAQEASASAAPTVAVAALPCPLALPVAVEPVGRATGWTISPDRGATARAHARWLVGHDHPAAELLIRSCCPLLFGQNGTCCTR